MTGSGHLTGRAWLSARSIRALVSITLLTAAIGYAISRTDAAPLATALAGLSISTAILVALAIAVAIGLSVVRMRVIAGGLGYRVPWADATAALSVGTVGGALFFQLAGQLIGRNLVLSRRAMPPEATVIITGIERAFALAISLALALCGILYLRGAFVSIDIQGGGAILVRIAAGLAVAGGACAIFCWRDEIANAGRGLTLGALWRGSVVVLLSLSIQIATLVAYLVAASVLAPQVPVVSFIAAITIVMFLGSVPISFAGWGVRELSAVAAFGALGVSPDVSIVIAALVGALYIIVAGIVAAVSLRLLSDARTTGPREAPQITVALDTAMGPLAAVLVFFSIYIPVNSGMISVNLADPVALVGGGLFILHYWTRREWPRWRAPLLNVGLAVLTIVVLFAYVLGLLNIGPSTWATTKVIGWFVLLGYLATGALAVAWFSRENIASVLWPYAVTGAAIVALDCLLLILSQAGVGAANIFLTPHFYGFSNNRNAFAFALVMALAASLAIENRGRSVTAVLVLLGVFLTGSRTGIVCAASVMLFACAMQRISMRFALTVSSAAVCAAVVLWAVLPNFSQITANGYALPSSAGRAGVSVRSSMGQHVETMWSGLLMFASHPIFGAGLGTYVETVRNYKEPVIIHSTPIWLLAEMGLVGFAAFAGVFIHAGKYLWQDRRSAAAVFGLMVLLTVALFVQLHEMLYQRSTWLLLGFALYAAKKRSAPN